MSRSIPIVVVAILGLPLAAAAASKEEKGQQVFVAQKCTLCHSVAGKGNAKGPLDDVGSKLTAAEIKQWIIDPVAMAQKTKAPRKPPMTKKAMAAEDVDALVAYLSALKKK
jgi:mono/diheme cytochrome c family protein